MAELAVITPSYSPDLELCKDLNSSIIANTPSGTIHYIITPRADLAEFRSLRGPRTEILCVDELLPRYITGIPMYNFWVNLRHPILPIRGWIMQQVVKLEAAARVDADVILLADSDVVLIHPITAGTFMSHGRLRFYRKEAAISGDLPRHVIWHEVARTLLGAERASLPLPDYITPFNVWDRRTILAMQRRIEQITCRPWVDAVVSKRHFSEFILYGVFIDEIGGSSRDITAMDSMLCHSYWGRFPLSLEEADRFVSEVNTEDVAIMISAKSKTALDIRRSIIDKLV